MKFNSIALGKTRGSMGNFTTQNWKGINVARAKPVDVANPNTPAQQAQRRKFALLVLWSKMLGSVLNVGLSKAAIKQTVFNLFTSLAFKNGAITDNGTIATLDPGLILVSSGSAVNIGAASASHVGNDVTVSITSLLGSAPPADSVMYGAVVANDDPLNPRLIGFANKVGITGNLVVNCSQAVNTSDATVYLFYVNSATNQPCDSWQYTF